jgi:hypothetical protein
MGADGSLHGLTRYDRGSEWFRRWQSCRRKSTKRKRIYRARVVAVTFTLERTATLIKKPTVVGSSTKMAGGIRWIPLPQRRTQKHRHRVSARTGGDLKPGRHKSEREKALRSRVSCKVWIATPKPGNKGPRARRKTATAEPKPTVREPALEETKRNRFIEDRMGD